MSITIEWKHKHAVIDPATRFTFGKFSSFIKRLTSLRVMFYSFNGALKPWWFGILNCIGPLTNSICNWASDRKLLCILGYCSTMLVNVVNEDELYLTLRFGWYFMSPLRLYLCPNHNENGTLSNTYILKPWCLTQW